jgi:hypothetical protein
MDTHKVLFLDDNNGHFFKNPDAILVEIPSNINSKIIESLEIKQSGVMRNGGDWKQILKDGKIEHKVLVEAKFKDFETYEYDFMYKVISGNY